MRSNLLKSISTAALALLSLAPAVLAQRQQVPAGTSLNIVLDQAVSTKNARVGQKLGGIVANSVIVDGKTLIQKGTKVTMAVADSQMAGPGGAPPKLLIRLDSIELNKKMLAVSASIAGQDRQIYAQNAPVNAPGARSGALVDSARPEQGEMVGASARATGEAENISTGNKQRDITIAAKTNLRFVLRGTLAIN